MTEEKKSILIVDDAYVNRVMLKKIFDEEYRVITAENGAEALKFMRLEKISALILV